MHRACPASVPLVWRSSGFLGVLLVAVALWSRSDAASAASITSSVLIDPVGETTGDVFGCSVAWIGDVNGVGRVSIFFGASAVDTVEDHYYVGNQSSGSLGLFVAGGGRVDGPGPTDVIASANYDPESIGYNQGRVYVFGNSFESTAVPPQTTAAGLRFVGPSPNPARNEVNLVLELDRAVPVRVTVFDLAGHEVARPIADEWLVGRVTRAWRPVGLPSGVYYVRASLGDRQQVRKVAWLGGR